MSRSELCLQSTWESDKGRMERSEKDYLNALRAYTATVPMTQYDVPEVSRRFRPHLPLHFAIQIAEK